MNKNTHKHTIFTEKEKMDKCFLEMVEEFKKETKRLEKEQQLLKEKEDEEFLQMVYECGIPVCYNNKITILDKKTNTIIDISNTNI
jgi:hypothetical protein